MNTKLVGLSIDSVEDHKGWIKDIQAYNGLDGEFPFPIVSDDRTLAVKLGMLDPDELDAKVGHREFVCLSVDEKHLGHAIDRSLCFCHRSGQEAKTFLALSGYDGTQL